MLVKEFESPVDEDARLKALYKYNILDTPPEDAFDSITELAARLLDTPIALISLVDHDRIWYKSVQGLEIDQIDRSPGFCASAILGTSPYLINAAGTDPRTYSNPLVTGDLGLRAYAAAPLRTRDGHNLGTLCCVDFKEREWTPEEVNILSRFAEIVVDRLELRQADRRISDLNGRIASLHRQLEVEASHDSLTGLWNRSAILTLANNTLALSRRQNTDVSVLIMDIDHLKTINEQWGHQVGDQVLKAVARRLIACLRESDSLGRLGGEEFIGFLYGCDGGSAVTVAERCREIISNQPISIEHNGYSKSLIVTISLGISSTGDYQDVTRDLLVKYADEALLKAKIAGRNQVAYQQ